jgi:hypothetical protein
MNSGPFSGTAGLYEGFYGGFGGHDHGFSQQLGASTSSVLLDCGARQLDTAVDVTDAPKRKGGGEREEKAATALRSHSEAERRRRERINAHLATLRSMVPSTDKVSAFSSSCCLGTFLFCTREFGKNSSPLSVRTIPLFAKFQTSAWHSGRHGQGPVGQLHGRAPSTGGACRSVDFRRLAIT